jgi:opacity protein-like surface antigen
MKNLFKLFALVAVMAISSASFAQVAQTTDKVGKDKASELTAKLSRKLTLTADQTATIKKMATDYFTSLEQLNKEDASYAEKKKRVEGDYINKMKEVLTAEQYTKFEEFVNEQKAAQAEKK